LAYVKLDPKYSVSKNFQILHMVAFWLTDYRFFKALMTSWSQNVCLSRLVIIMTPNTSSEYKQNIGGKSEKLWKKLWRALERWYFLLYMIALLAHNTSVACC